MHSNFWSLKCFHTWTIIAYERCWLQFVSGGLNFLSPKCSPPPKKSLDGALHPFLSGSRMEWHGSAVPPSGYAFPQHHYPANFLQHSCQARPVCILRKGLKWDTSFLPLVQCSGATILSHESNSHIPLPGIHAWEINACFHSPPIRICQHAY